MPTFSGLLCLGSLALLVHATLCAIQHRDYLKAIETPFSYSPPEIALQCAAAVLIGTWGVMGVQGSFLPIRTTEVLGKQTIDFLDASPDFLHFNHRELR